MQELKECEENYTILNHLGNMQSNCIDFNCTEIEIIEYVEKWLESNPLVISESRSRELVDQRRMLYFILKKNTRLTLKSIGQVLGGKDHGTVLYGIRTHRNLIAINDTGYLYNCKNIREKFKNIL